ncbi:MAG TPA: protocatechuate 3,4-dioxygenase subunit alpha [Devosiaceae bacterium]|jgi:protocatechuate 3,4-dioxygenase alpha subunit
MLNKLVTLKETPSQTGGPYVHIGLVPNFAEIHGVYAADLGATMLAPDTEGQRITVSGRILDGAGAPVTDAVIELWQADADGSYAGQSSPHSNSGPTFTGFGRQATNADGVYRFETIKPGPVTGPDGKPMAPHLTLWITARGINIGLHTRAYFADEADANAVDPVLSRVQDPLRRATLVAAATDPGAYRFDIRLQGDGETVFFDI